MSKIKRFDYSSAIGRSFGNFVVVRELGRGAMGAVFLGYQKSLKRQVAIKLLPKALAKTPLARQQFRDEAETIAVLHHPNIITIFDTGEDELFFFQVMQLIDGEDFASVLRKLAKHPVPRKRLLALDHVYRIMIEILAGLQAAHDQNVVHQDLKPANILIENRGGRAIIADFGIAKTKEIEYRTRGLLVGTPIYLAPEQAAAGDTDYRADLYAVGIMLLELLAGHLPIRGENARQTVMRKARKPDSFFLKRPSECDPRVTAELEQVILKATAIRPEQRFASSDEFAQALTAAWS